jgi:hypothetical protein
MSGTEAQAEMLAKLVGVAAAAEELTLRHAAGFPVGKNKSSARKIMAV